MIQKQFLGHHAAIELLKEKSARIDSLERRSWLQRQHQMRATLRVRTVKQELEEKTLRGDVKGLVENINVFLRNGGDEKRKALLPFVCDLMRSAALRDKTTDAGSKKMRWHKTSKQVLAVIKKKGGGGSGRFVCATLGSAADSTVMAEWNGAKVRLKPGEYLVNVVVVAVIYKQLMARLGIEGPVPYELQEDETYMNARYAFDAWRDITLGTCGKAGPEHQCNANHEHEKLGSGVEAFHRIERGGLEDKRGSYLRAVMVVPLHPRLPALPIVVHCTCLSFDHQWIHRSWERLVGFCRIALRDSLGPQPQGHGSDGASPLFLAMKQRMRIPAGPGRFSLDAPGLLLTGLLVELDGKWHVAHLDMQDPRHDLSKLYAVLDSAIRDFTLGEFHAAHYDWLETARLANKNNDSHGAIQK